MLIKFNTYAALVTTAAFAYSSFSLAQAPIIDASVDSRIAQTSQRPADGAGQANAGDAIQGELFLQLQVLQQEVMQLRGLVEENVHVIKKMKEQNMERYIDLDRRIGRSVTQPVPVVVPKTDVVQLPSSSSLAQEGEKPRYDAAYKLVINKRFDQALVLFRQFIVDFPAGKYAPNSLYWMGELYQVIDPQDLEAARQSFAQLLNEYPNHSKAADAMYKLGKVYYQKGSIEKSRKWMEQLVAQYGDGVNSAADKARQFLSTKLSDSN